MGFDIDIFNNKKHRLFMFSFLSFLLLSNGATVVYCLLKNISIDYLFMFYISVVSFVLFAYFFKADTFDKTTYIEGFFDSLFLVALIEIVGISLFFLHLVMSHPSENGYLVDLILVFIFTFNFMLKFISFTLISALINTFWVVTYQRKIRFK